MVRYLSAPPTLYFLSKIISIGDTAVLLNRVLVSNRGKCICMILYYEDLQEPSQMYEECTH